MADYNPQPKWNRKIYGSWLGRRVCRVFCMVEDRMDGLSDENERSRQNLNTLHG